MQWVRSVETAEDINKNHRNSEYLGDEVKLPESLRATNDFNEAANCADVIVMGVPSHGFRSVLNELAKELRPWVPVVSLVKGLEQGTNMRMSQIVDEVLPGHAHGVFVQRIVVDDFGGVARMGAGDHRQCVGADRGDRVDVAGQSACAARVVGVEGQHAGRLDAEGVGFGDVVVDGGGEHGQDGVVAEAE